MATDSPPDILDRNLSKAWVRHWIDLATPILQEIVNHGIAAFKRCSKTGKGGDENAAILMPYLHLLEMVDGIQVLLAEAAPVAARLQLRSVFEALLTIEYITETDTKKRAYAYLVADIRDRLAAYRRLDPNTPQGKMARKRMEDDKCVQDVQQMPEIPDLSERIENLEKLLKKPHWKEADAEFQAVKKRLKGRSPAWYQLYGGPNNLDALATHLKRAGEYDILYRRWSRTAHAADAIQRIGKGKKGEVFIRRIRDTSEFNIVTSFAAFFAVMATSCVVTFLRPGERWEGWYLREVRETLTKFTRREGG